MATRSRAFSSLFSGFLSGWKTVDERALAYRDRVVAVLAWLGSRSWKLVAGTVVAFLVIGYFGMWEDTMATLAIISVATLLCISLGIPLGIWMAKSNRAQAAITPCS